LFPKFHIAHEAPDAQLLGNPIQRFEIRPRKKVDVIFCGHTHIASLGFVDEILYGNDGSWQSDDPHFIGIRGAEVQLCKYTGNRSTTIRIETL